MSNPLLEILSVAEGVALVLVLAIALLRIKVRLRTIAEGLDQLAKGVSGVEGHLRLIAPTVPTVNAPLHDIVGALPSIAEMAETLAGSMNK